MTWIMGEVEIFYVAPSLLIFSVRQSLPLLITTFVIMGTLSNRWNK